MECGGTQLGQCLNLQQRGRPPLPGGRDGLARSFVHCSTHHFRKERGSKRLAVGNPGAIGSRCDAGLLRGTYERCRGESTDQTTINVVTDEVLTFGLKSWSRGQKVRLLLLFAQVECRPSWAPPISMDILSTRQRLMAIRVNAHCL